MKVIKETLWKKSLSTPTKPSAKNGNICLSETAYQHKRTRKKCKKTNQAAIIQWQRQCLMYKPHRKPWPKSKTSDIFKQSLSPLHHTFLLGRARFTAQPLSALFPPVLENVCRAFSPGPTDRPWVSEDAQSHTCQHHAEVTQSHTFAALSLSHTHNPLTFNTSEISSNNSLSASPMRRCLRVSMGLTDRRKTAKNFDR